MSGRSGRAIAIGAGLVALAVAAVATYWGVPGILPGVGAAPPAIPLQVAPARLDFGEIEVGQDVHRFVVVTNLGDEPMAVGSIRAEAPFRVMAAEMALPAGESRSMGISYSPTSAGDATGTVEFATAEGRVSVEVAGSAQGHPAMALDPLFVDFGQVEVGGVGRALLTIENRGEGDLRLEQLVPRGPFAVELDGDVVAAGERVSAFVRFEPPESTDWKGELLVVTNDPERGRIRVSLTGAGVDRLPQPALEVAPRALDFGEVAVGGARRAQLTIRNHGVDPLTIASVTLPTPFKTSTRSRHLAPGGVLRLPVECAPNRAGSLFEPLVIASNDPANPLLNVPLICNGSLSLAAAGGADGGAGGAGGSTLGIDVALGGDGSVDVDVDADGRGRARDADPDALVDPEDRGDDGEDVAALEPDPQLREEDGPVWCFESHCKHLESSVFGEIAFDANAGQIVMTDVQLPRIGGAMNEYFTFDPVDRAVGTVNPVTGAIEIPMTVTMYDRWDNPTTTTLVLTTEVSEFKWNNQPVFRQGVPLTGGQAELVAGANFPFGGPAGNNPIYIKVPLGGLGAAE